MTSHEGLRADRIFNAAPPELFFILSAIAQYTGAIIAVNLFDEVSPATVAWLRVLSASLILLAFSSIMLLDLGFEPHCVYGSEYNHFSYYAYAHGHLF